MDSLSSTNSSSQISQLPLAQSSNSNTTLALHHAHLTTAPSQVHMSTLTTTAPSKQIADMITSTIEEMLENDLQELMELETYRNKLDANKADNIQPNSFLEDWKYLPLMVAAANIDNPELNLQEPFESVTQFQEHINAKSGDFHDRAIVNVQPRGLYCVAFDVHRANNITSFICVAPATREEPQTALKKLLKETSKAVGTVIFANVQYSDFDCVMFSHSFALKMKDHETAFTEWHAKRQGQDCIEAKGTKQLEIISKGENLLPAAFLKHIHSLSGLQKIIKAREHLATDGVNSHRKTLFERFQEHQVKRQNKRSYSASIENKRISVVNRSLDTLLNVVNRQATRQHFLDLLDLDIGTLEKQEHELTQLHSKYKAQAEQDHPLFGELIDLIKSQKDQLIHVKESDSSLETLSEFKSISTNELHEQEKLINNFRAFVELNHYGNKIEQQKNQFTVLREIASDRPLISALCGRYIDALTDKQNDIQAYRAQQNSLDRHDLDAISNALETYTNGIAECVPKFQRAVEHVTSNIRHA